MRRVLIVLAVTLLGAAGCGGDSGGGDSAADRALSDVCDARADIARQTEELRGMTAAEVAGGAARDGLAAIRSDLSTIGTAQKELSDERREQVQQANDAFSTELRSIASEVALGLGREDAGDQARAALQSLTDAYRETYDRIDCPEE